MWDLRGVSRNRDCHRTNTRALKVSTDEAFTISSGNLFQNGTTRKLKICWQRWMLHRCRCIMKARWGQQRLRPMVNHEGSVLFCFIQIRPLTYELSLQSVILILEIGLKGVGYLLF